MVKCGLWSNLCQEAAGHPSCHHCRPPPRHSIHYGSRREDPVAWSHHQHWVQSTSTQATAISSIVASFRLVVTRIVVKYSTLVSSKFDKPWTTCVVYICPPICASVFWGRAKPSENCKTNSNTATCHLTNTKDTSSCQFPALGRISNAPVENSHGWNRSQQ